MKSRFLPFSGNGWCFIAITFTQLISKSVSSSLKLNDSCKSSTKCYGYSFILNTLRINNIYWRCLIYHSYLKLWITTFLYCLRFLAFYFLKLDYKNIWVQLVGDCINANFNAPKTLTFVCCMNTTLMYVSGGVSFSPWNRKMDEIYL